MVKGKGSLGKGSRVFRSQRGSARKMVKDRGWLGKGSRVFRGWRRTARDPEDGWYDPVPHISDIPLRRPSSEHAIHGLASATQEMDRLNEARPEDGRPTIVHRLFEVAKPRFRRVAQGPPKPGYRKPH
jgi:hypothetical protein